MNKLNQEEILPLLKVAIEEDIGTGDVTTDAIVPETLEVRGYFLSKADGILAGMDVSLMVFWILDNSINILNKFEDGKEIKKGDVIAEIKGNARAILEGERVSLNILQKLSGIATLTSKFAEEVKGTGAKILDTRKTTPILRKLEKYAVRIGGGENHRFGLYDAVLIKDNHIRIAGGIGPALKKIQGEIEVRNKREFIEAVENGAKRVLLDNMEIPEIEEIVKINRERALLEVSGGINLENVREYANTGVDYISVGMLTHSASALDISFEIENSGHKKM